ncbi:MAG TPA: agmatine deiminase family protein, partial [Rhodothermales bacterium]|nr:agmatine deiminase family protein [Rhodothermales bacterium]
MTAPRSPFRMPAEWDRHRATWFSWPHSVETWPDELPEVEAALAFAAKALARHEPVHVGTLGPEHRKHIGALLDAQGVRGEVIFHDVPTDDAWARDHGAIFVKDAAGALTATVWGFNSWGGKYPYDRDALVAREMATIFSAPVVEGGIILEGGSIEVNGAGTLLTTEACLLNPNRNPGLTKADIEARLADLLGATHVVWLGDGIAGDDTDGHIDDLTRFVDAETVVTVMEEDPADVNFDPLRENFERLRGARLPSGKPFRIETLPMPAPVISKGERLPASYANFYVANGVVLLPVFGDINDRLAVETMGRLFPGREIVPVPCREVVWGLG